MLRNKVKNEKIAQKLVSKTFEYSRMVLILFGKPFFNLLSYVFIFILFLSYFANHVFTEFLKESFSTIMKFFISIFDSIYKKELETKKLVRKRVKLISKISIRDFVKLKRIQARYKFFLVIIFSIFGAFLILLSIIFNNLPNPEQLVNRKVNVSTRIYDRNGVLLYSFYKDENRTLISLDNVPHKVRLSTLAAEDAEFYNHPGFSIRGIMRAAIRNYKNGELTGGSTITQQLVKNTLLTPEKTYIRKVREIFLAVLVEMRFSKNEILEMYLNEVSFGGTAYGIQEAAHVYFDKSVDELTIAESALLAGLPKSPTAFSPFGLTPEKAIERQHEVLRLMKINSYISEEQYQKSLEEKTVFAENKIDIKAPHFVMYVKSLLDERYGKEVSETGGLEVITTLDYEIQESAEQTVKEEVDKLSNLNVGNGAAIVLDPKNGEILAMVGSKDFFDTESDGNVNVTTRLQQPGSSIKVVNYAYALSHGYTPATILDDSPIEYVSQGQPSYKPQNYDGKYRGKITLRSALAESRNIPAIKTLNNFGVEKMIEMGKKMGIDSWNNPSDYGLSLTLGGGDTTLLELSSVYGTIANLGQRPNITPIVKITNYEGTVLQTNGCNAKSDNKIKTIVQNALDLKEIKSSCEIERALDPRVAYQLIDILKDNNARAPAFGSHSLLVIPNHDEVAVKTGTSNDLRDNLAIGFSPNYLVAVWVGNNDNSPMSRVASGITGATPIWHKIMVDVLKNETEQWTIPEGLVELPVCKLTGTLTCVGCPTYMEYFLEENKPEAACSQEYIEKIIADYYEKRSQILGDHDESKPTPQLLNEAAQVERR